MFLSYPEVDLRPLGTQNMIIGKVDDKKKKMFTELVQGLIL